MTVVTLFFNQLQCNIPGGEGVGDLTGIGRRRRGFGSKKILWLSLQHQDRMGTLLVDHAEMEASEAGMEAGPREAGRSSFKDASHQDYRVGKRWGQEWCSPPWHYYSGLVDYPCSNHLEFCHLKYGRPWYCLTEYARCLIQGIANNQIQIRRNERNKIFYSPLTPLLESG